MNLDLCFACFAIEACVFNLDPKVLFVANVDEQGGPSPLSDLNLH